MRTLILLPLAALLACAGTKTEQGLTGTSGEDGASGEEGVPGEDGEDGEPGADGEDGEDGLPCWDLDGDGEPDPEEDTNGDGVVDVDDCRNDGSSGGDDTGDYPDPDMVEVTAGYAYACGLYETGDVYCWGYSGRGEGDAPEGLYKILAANDVSGGDLSCGITSADTLNCWGYDSSGSYADMPSGTYTDVAIHADIICAIATDGEMVCSYEDWLFDPGDGTDLITGEFIDMDVGDMSVCGVRPEGTLECWDYHSFLSPTPEGTYVQVTNGTQWACALTTMGSIECWSNASPEIYGSIALGVLEAPEGDGYTAISAGLTHACAIDADGYVTCWGDTGYGAENPPLFMRFKSISAGGQLTCGITVDEELACWGYAASETPTW